MESRTYVVAIVMAVSVTSCFGILTHVSNSADNDCPDHYYRSFYSCTLNCTKSIVCKEEHFHDKICFFCETPADELDDFDAEECDGIRYTGLCRQRFSFEKADEARQSCKNQTYYKRKYVIEVSDKRKTISCFRCTRGLNCE